MTCSIRGASSMAATIARWTSGLADSPISKLFISTASTAATQPSSAPIPIEPAPSHRPSPVTVDTVTAHNAKPRPISAAKSSRSTIGSSGAFACLMNALHGTRRRDLFDWLMAVRNEKASSAIATARTVKATAGESTFSGWMIRLIPSYSEKIAPTTNRTTATINA
jgi:hypothetical protein